MTDYLSRAIEAAKLAKKGKTKVEIKDALGFRYAADAQTAIEIGTRYLNIEERRLTSDELELVLAVASAQRRALERGDSCAPKFKHLSLWPWKLAKIRRLARARLDVHRLGEELLPSHQWTGLGLIDAYHGGYVLLRPAGWALVHLLKGQQQP